MTPYDHGISCAQAGYSIHYNPYRHKGTAQQFIEWERGWNAGISNNSSAE